MKKYAFMYIYGTVEVEGDIWYYVSYDGQDGYVNGKYFKQMTNAEAEAFLYSDRYVQGIVNNGGELPATVSGDPIKVSMELSKYTFSESETITVSITVTNTSDSDMPAPVKLYYPNGKQIEEFGAPVLSAGDSKRWTGNWEVIQEQLEAGKVAFKISYAYYENNGEGTPQLVRKGKNFSKKITYTGAISSPKDEAVQGVHTPTPEPTWTPAPAVTLAPSDTVILEGVLLNRYAVTSVGKLAFREQPGPDGKIICRLDKDTAVFLLQAAINDDGDSWTYAELGDGSCGYIKTEYLNMMTAEESAKFNPGSKVYTEEEAYPTPEPTSIPTSIPTEEPMVLPTPTPTELPTPTPTLAPFAADTPAPEIPVDQLINRYGKTSSSVHFRKEASTNSKNLGDLKKNVPVWLIYTFENELGETWTYAMVNGKTGYIMTMYLDLLTAEDSAELEALASPVPRFTLEDVFPTAEPPI